MASATYLHATVGNWHASLECIDGRIHIKLTGPDGLVAEVGPKALGVQCNQVDAEEAVDMLRKPEMRNAIPLRHRKDYDRVVNALDRKVAGSGLPRHPTK